MPLLALPPEILVALAGHLSSTQDYLALSVTSRQLRACCLSVRPKYLRLIMSRTLSAALDKAASDRYLDSLTACRFCDWYFADPENRKTFRRTATTKRYNLVLGIVCHETKDVCGGCLTLALVVKYCWFPWYEAGVNMPEALRIGYLAAIEHNVADPERYGH